MEIYEVIAVHVSDDYFSEGEVPPNADVKTTLYASLSAAKADFLERCDDMSEDMYNSEMDAIDKGYAYASFLTNDLLFLRRAEVVPARKTA